MFVIYFTRFKTFEHGVKDIREVVEHWERGLGVCRAGTPIDGGEQESPDNMDKSHPQSGRKGAGGKKPGKPLLITKSVKMLRFQLVNKGYVSDLFA